VEKETSKKSNWEKLQAINLIIEVKGDRKGMGLRKRGGGPKTDLLLGGAS